MMTKGRETGPYEALFVTATGDTVFIAPIRHLVSAQLQKKSGNIILLGIQKDNLP